jgi:glycosyltransferase involved in cell wall biosynthesis
MRILVVTRYFYPRLGGGEIVLWQILRGLAQKGHQTYVITSKFGSAPGHEIKNGIEIFRPFNGDGSAANGLSFSLRLCSFLVKFLKSTPVDVIINGAYSCTIPAAHAAHRHHLPSITYVTYYFGKTWFRLVNPLSALFNCIFPAATLFLANSDIICCPSKMVSDKIKPFSKSKITVIPSPIDTVEIQKIKDGTFTLEIRKHLGIENGQRFLVFVGRLSPEKNICNLIKTLKFSELNAKLIIVGEGPERKKIEKLIRRSGLESRVSLLGRKSHEDTLAIIKAGDALILPSITEVFPTVILEALSLEKPVISTRVGGVSEFVSDNLYLIDDLDKINHIISGNIESRPDPFILKRYSLDSVVSSFEEMCQKAQAF